MRLEQYIHKLLLQNDCVIIPSFGAFIANMEPSRFDPVEYSIKPPNKKIAFNNQLTTNDGLLVNAVANAEGCSYEKALSQVKAQVQFWVNRLDTERVLTLDFLGQLAYSSNNTIDFTPLDEKNYLVSSFGLESIKASYILTGGKTIGQQQTSSVSWWKAAALIPLVVGGYLYFKTPVPVEQFVNEQWSGFFVPRLSQSIEKNKTVKNQSKIIVDEKTSKIKDVNKTPTEEVKNFKLIVGAFVLKEEAEAMIEQLNNQGFYESRIIQKGKFNLVAINSYITEEEANEFKRAFAIAYPQAWLYKTKEHN